MTIVQHPGKPYYVNKVCMFTSIQLINCWITSICSDIHKTIACSDIHKLSPVLTYTNYRLSSSVLSILATDWNKEMLHVLKQRNVTCFEIKKCYMFWNKEMQHVLKQRNATCFETKTCKMFWNKEMQHVLKQRNAICFETKKCNMFYYLIN